ncbi:MAG: hypothetical protein JWN75_694 [Candidatus Saccharibacteria bacterium]|nr:hypothetical protein [Candidatus Saccharibacteria bacterium]
MTTAAVTIHFDTDLITIGKRTIARIPETESVKLPSRGQIAVTGTVNSHDFQTVLEPDGYWSHYIKFDANLQNELGIGTGDTITVEITPTKQWPEPMVPKDVADALASSPENVKTKWQDITPMARWEWIRWVNSTGNSDTRTIRIEKTISKLNGKHRRPCCFNLAACTDPELSKSGRLSIPQNVA